MVARPEQSRRGIVLYSRDSEGGTHVVACSRVAIRYGIRPGMSLAEATALQEAEGAVSGSRNASPLGAAEAFQRPEMVGVDTGTPSLSSSSRDPMKEAVKEAVKDERSNYGGLPFDLVEHHPEADAEELARLAEWCERFSPIVGFESLDRYGRECPLRWSHDCLYMDVTHVSSYFGGEDQLARRVVESFSQRGYLARVAVADTLGAAWACARFASRRATVAGRGDQRAVPRVSFSKAGANTGETPCSSFMVVPSADTFTVLQALPVQSLRLPAHICHLLEKLGITQVAQLARLPREGLATRFGEILPRRWDQMFGRVDEVLAAHRPAPQFRTDWSLEHATTDQATIRSILDRLLEQVTHALKQQGRGVIQCTFNLSCSAPVVDSDLERSVLSPLYFRIGLSHPTTSVGHLNELVEMKLERRPLSGPVQRIVVEASLTAPLGCRQRRLFSDGVEHEARHLNQLLDRLSSRLGASNVIRPALVPEAQPELAYRDVPLTVGDEFLGRGVGEVKQREGKGKGDGKVGQSARGAGQIKDEVERERRGRERLKQRRPSGSIRSRRRAGRRLIRPLHLRSPPLPLNVVAVAPDGPPAQLLFGRRSYRVLRFWGPERIETGWWRGRTVGRDYYRLEIVSGHWLWVFRRFSDGNWFLHGTFG